MIFPLQIIVNFFMFISLFFTILFFHGLSIFLLRQLHVAINFSAYLFSRQKKLLWNEIFFLCLHRTKQRRSTSDNVRSNDWTELLTLCHTRDVRIFGDHCTHTRYIVLQCERHPHSKLKSNACCFENQRGLHPTNTTVVSEQQPSVSGLCNMKHQHRVENVRYV